MPVAKPLWERCPAMSDRHRAISLPAMDLLKNVEGDLHMKTRQLVITAALLAMTGGAMAQQSTTDVPASPGMVAPASTANGVSSDPFVQKRQSDADAKADYKAQKKAVNQQAKADKKAAKKEMKASTAERNAQLAQPQPKSDLNKGQ